MRTIAWLLLAFAAAALVTGLVATLQSGAGHRTIPTAVAALDTDGDGVPDVYENAVFGSDPQRRSALLLPESWVRDHGLDVSDPDLANRTARYPVQGEAPGIYGPAGLPERFRMSYLDVYAYGRPADWTEARDGAWDSRLDPLRFDVDRSGVAYAWLIHFALDPFAPAVLDTIPTGADVPWTPREAYHRGLDPRSPDGDRDGLLDVEEQAIGTDPRAFSTSGSGIADGWLVAHGFDPLDMAVAFTDTDNDGLSNLAEFEASMRLFPEMTLQGGGLDPRRASTVGGPIPDGWLVHHGLDPLDSEIAMQVTQTLDVEDKSTIHRLTLRVIDEHLANRPPLWDEARQGPWFGGTDPNNNDTDDDGLPDVLEIRGWNITTGAGWKHVRSSPTSVDTDSDGLTDAQERRGEVGGYRFSPTDPSNPDSDSDGLSDGEELGLVPWKGILLPVLDPNDEDTDHDGLLDGEEAMYWLGRYESYVGPGARYAWGPDPKPTAAEVFARAGRSALDSLAELLPGGDIDGDRLPNIIDPDADNDGLLDGWEVKPRQYSETVHASPHGRPATDPGNPDTDLDGLPDAWEVAYGVHDDKLKGWNLDPSQWSSFRDTTSDADRDLDDDSIIWYSYERTSSGVRAQAHVFKATNKVEFESGSNPNRRSSSPDGIPDGWKIFWGRTYVGLLPEDRGVVYPGAPDEFSLPPDRPLPRIGANDDRPLSELTYQRYQPAHGTLLPWETGQSVTVKSTAGESSDLSLVRGVVTLDVKGVVANSTNPYLDDTDGDGAPDIWESVWTRLGTTRARTNPLEPDADVDLDGDGLDNRAEWRAGSDPYRRDSDAGGVDDGIEIRLGLSPIEPADDALALDSNTDTDGDGVPDNAELLGKGGKITDPLDPDTDHDGLLDGRRLSSILGRDIRVDDADDAERLRALEARGLIVIRRADGTAEILGEADVASDPLRTSTAGDGVPDGWAAFYGFAPSVASGQFAAYSYGRPEWWNETQHGVWRWGLRPGGTPTRDHDGDGLDDRNGEDPIPHANPSNLLPRGHPNEAELTGLERLLRAQAYGGPTMPTTARDRPAMGVALDPLPPTLLSAGETRFTGNVTTVAGIGVPNVTVILSLGTRDFVLGVAVTNATGGYEGSVWLASTLDAPEESRGVTVFGRDDGGGRHTNAAASLGSLDPDALHDVFTWTYNVSWFPPPRQSYTFPLPNGTNVTGALGGESTRQRANLTLPTSFQFEYAARAPTGSSLPVNVTLADALGRPVAHAEVTLTPGGKLVLDAKGRATADFSIPLATTPFHFNASYAGNGALRPSNGTATVQPFDETVLSLFPLPTALRPGETFAFGGSLSTTRGVPIVDVQLRLQFAGEEKSILTDAEGRFRSVERLAGDASLGRHTAQAIFSGNATLAPASVGLTIQIAGAPRFNATAVEGRPGDRVELSGRLTDVAGAPLRNRSVALDGLVPWRATGVSDADGRVRFQLDLGGVAPGGYVASLRFTDPIDGTALHVVPVTVFTSTRLDIQWEGLLRGETTRVSARLTDASGAPLAGQAVALAAGPMQRRVITDARGDASTSFAFGVEHRTGPLTLAGRYAGSPDGVYLPSSHEVSGVLRDGALFHLDDTTVLVQRPALSGRLTTLLGEPLHGKEIRIRTDGATVPATTDGRGGLRLLLPLLPSQPLGAMRSTFVLEDEPLLRGFALDEPLFLKDAGRLTTSVPLSALQGETLRMVVAVRDSTGRDVPGATLRVRLDDESLSSLHGDGTLMFSIPDQTPPGPHTLSIQVDSPYVAVEPATSTLDVRQLTRLALQSAMPTVPGRPGEISVRLDRGGTPLAGETLLLIDGGPVPIEVMTGADGVARVPISATGTHARSYSLIYPGAGINGASSLTVELASVAAPVQERTELAPWAFGAIALAALLLAGHFVRRIRASPTNVLRSASRDLRSDHPNVKALYEAYLRLLALRGVEEDAQEHLTFSDVLLTFIEPTIELRPDLDQLTEVFNQAVYAPHLLSVDVLHRTGVALDRIASLLDASRQMEAPT